MILKIEYTDKKTQKQRVIEVDAVMDVVAVIIESQAEKVLPALKVNINTDAVIVDTVAGSKLLFKEYVDLVNEVESDNALVSEDTAFVEQCIEEHGGELPM